VKVVIILLVVIIILAALVGSIMSKVEQPKYKVLRSKGNIELREYEPMIIAEVEVSGERKEAIRQGFKILADFIFGNNVSKKRMEMTAPVTNQLSEKIAMTAPVMQEGHMDKWKVRFVMPAKYSLETLPKPNSKEVTLISAPAKCFAVIRFSGFADDASIKKNTQELENYIVAENLKIIGKPIIAFYNPPWTVPFLRRNEVMVEVE
jgi:hypothetical protein